MRVLIIPELYRPTNASANATLNDAVTWVEQWLRLDDTLHVYWLLPHRGTANYGRSYVLADRDRVSLVEADPLMSGEQHEGLFTEGGYSKEQLLALKRRIYDELGYIDVVVDQLRRGRSDLQKWLLALAGHRATDPTPFAVITNVHDLMLPFKYPTDGQRTDYHRKLEVVEAVFSDGIWFKARLDAEEMRVYGREFLPLSLLTEAVDEAILTESPIDFSRFDEQYAKHPEWLHVAGSSWEKKHPEIVMDIAERLYEQYGIRTVLTSMDEIPDEYSRKPWVEAHPAASRETYETALRKGDLAVCATEYDTLARTWFEQAASGQVLVIRDEPWIDETIPDDYPLVASVDELGDRICWAVDHWADAVDANRTLVEYVRGVRSPERSGRKTYTDLTRHVEERIEAYATTFERETDPTRSAVRRAIRDIDSETISLDELNRRGSRVSRDEEPFLEQEDCTLTDLVFVLRTEGYVDRGNPGAPIFVRDEDAS